MHDETSLSELLSPGLYVTATPIGNASDASLRSLSVLRAVDGIVAEDTRVTAKLLAIHGIANALTAYNDHNAPAQRPKILQRLRQGARLALVSDAGTPLISDPGYKLVREARDEGLPVFAVPGPSAVLAALSIAGLPSDQFFFSGFLPPKAGERQNALQQLRDIPATLIFFEAAPRLAATLSAMSVILGEREAAIARELTKLHEEVRRGRLAELAEYYGSAAPPKGEIVILIGPPEKSGARASVNADSLLRQALAHMPVSAAAALVADATGENRRTLYDRALALKGVK